MLVNIKMLSDCMSDRATICEKVNAVICKSNTLKKHPEKGATLAPVYRVLKKGAEEITADLFVSGVRFPSWVATEENRVSGKAYWFYCTEQGEFIAWTESPCHHLPYFALDARNARRALGEAELQKVEGIR